MSKKASKFFSNIPHISVAVEQEGTGSPDWPWFIVVISYIAKVIKTGMCLETILKKMMLDKTLSTQIKVQFTVFIVIAISVNVWVVSRQASHKEYKQLIELTNNSIATLSQKPEFRVWNGLDIFNSGTETYRNEEPLETMRPRRCCGFFTAWHLKNAWCSMHCFQKLLHSSRDSKTYSSVCCRWGRGMMDQKMEGNETRASGSTMSEVSITNNGGGSPYDK